MGLLKFWLLEQSFLNRYLSVKFMFSKKATKMDEIFTVDLTVITYFQIVGEDLVNFVAFSKNVNLACPFIK